MDEELFFQYLHSKEYMAGMNAERMQKERVISEKLFGDIAENKKEFLREYILLQAERQYEAVYRAFFAGYNWGQEKAKKDEGEKK